MRDKLAVTRGEPTDYFESRDELEERVGTQVLNFYATKCGRGCTELEQYEGCEFWRGLAYLELKNSKELPESEIAKRLTITHKELAKIAHWKNRSRRDR